MARVHGIVVALDAAVVALYVPYTYWKVVYYGDLLPNTYYAKSADLAWTAQGLRFGFSKGKRNVFN